MQVNSVNCQKFGSLNVKKCSLFANDLKNNDVLKKAAKQYNIKAYETNRNAASNNEYIYDVVLEIQEKAKSLFNKLFKKANKGTITIESTGSIKPSKISNAIKELDMSDIEKSVSKQENIVKKVEKGSAEKIFKDAELDFRYKDKFGELPQDSMSDGVKKYYHTDFSPEHLLLQDLQQAMKTEIELKYMGEMGLI